MINKAIGTYFLNFCESMNSYCYCKEHKGLVCGYTHEIFLTNLQFCNDNQLMDK